MVTRLSVVAVGVVGLLVLAAVPVAAHHAFSSEFDSNSTSTSRSRTGRWKSG